MKKIAIELRRKANWPIVGNRFLAWKADDGMIITIKENKIGLFIMRANGTLIAATVDEEVMIDWIIEQRWQKSGIV